MISYFQVYAWGSNADGQLGLGPDAEETVFTPAQIDLSPLDGATVTRVACGYHHSAMVTDSGALYVFGDPEGGRLGLGAAVAEKGDPVEVPTRVTEGLEGEEVRKTLLQEKCHATFGLLYFE